MQEITSTTQPLPDRLRKEHVPANGDIYLYMSENFFRLCNRRETEYGVRYDREEWCFAEKKWVPYRYGDVSEKDLLESRSYRLCLAPVDELLSETDRIFSGQVIEEKVEEAETTALVAMGSRLPDMLSQTEMLEDRMQTMEVIYRARMDEVRYTMEKRLEPLKALAKTVRKQLRNIQRAISIVEIYAGENVEIVTLREGTPASEDTPVTIRQRILFMDEECAVLDEDGQGMDFWTRDRFYEWIKEPKHRNIILPEEKCIVVAKPRRYDRHYSNDPYEQAKMNQWNRHSFIFIRNGENVHVIESEDLCIYGTVVPRKADYASIEKEAEHWKDNAQERLDNLSYRCIHFAMVLQGINDRTDIFAPHGEINFVKDIGTQIVFDDEEDSLLGTGRLDFRAWLREQAKTIRRGSRVLFISGLSGGEPMRWEYQGNARNNYVPLISAPNTGLYTVEEKKDGKFGITYLPSDPWCERTRRETWLIEKETVINYDTVKAEDIRGYLEDRTQRRYYQHVIPLLKKYEVELRKEQEYEGLFLSALRRTLDEKHIPYTEESLQDALKWWKTKVIHVRPIAADDDKAWRMIIGRIKSRKNYESN